MDEIAIVLTLMLESARATLDDGDQHFVAPTPIHIEEFDIRAIKVLLAIAKQNKYDIFATRDNLVSLMSWIPLVSGNKALRQIESQVMGMHDTNIGTIEFLHLVDETLDGDIASPDLFMLAHRAYWWLVFVSKLVLGTRDAKGLDNILDEEE